MTQQLLNRIGRILIAENCAAQCFQRRGFPGFGATLRILDKFPRQFTTRIKPPFPDPIFHIKSLPFSHITNPIIRFLHDLKRLIYEFGYLIGCGLRYIRECIELD